MRRRFLFGVVCAVVTFHSFAQVPQSSETNPEEQAAVRWIRQNAIPLKTVEAGNGFADMEPLDKIVGDARVVALGEATHGTREFFQLKHRMIEYLATRKGFTIFSIEASMPEAYRLNKYVLAGEGDPKQLVKGMGFWTWDTEEVLDMVLWMREFNRSGKGRIEFTGFDMQAPKVPMETVRDFLLAHDAPYYEGTVVPVYGLGGIIAPRATQGSFAAATARLPGSEVAGKHVSIAGYMRSEDIAGGYAGLWMRSDGPNGVLEFKNLGQENITGTTAWRRYEVSLDVPANATLLSFGATQSGSGTAWLDSMVVTIDGQQYGDPGIDLGFESSTPKGFHTGGEGYEVTLDKSVVQSGAQSLRLRRLSTMPDNGHVDASTVQEKCGAVAEYLEQNRGRYVQAGASEVDTDWVVQSARLVQEYVELKAGTRTRDESMADNVDWIVKHNGHVSNTGFGSTHSMGSYLRQMYGKQMVNFGFAFNEGSFRAAPEVGKSAQTFTVPPAPKRTLDNALAVTGIPLFAVDIRRVPDGTPAGRWFAEAHKSRSVGAVFSDSLEPSLWSPGPAKSDFDVLLFVEKTTAARGNQ
jgi:erythromycin esterase-like protein